VVCGEEHERPIRAALRLPRARVLVEPERRNTAAAVAFARGGSPRRIPTR
jgi:mannose-1-phosphate guanylyltransferase